MNIEAMFLISFLANIFLLVIILILYVEIKIERS